MATQLGKKITGFPQNQAQMAEWQAKYTFDKATSSWYEKPTTTTTTTTTPSAFYIKGTDANGKVYVLPIQEKEYTYYSNQFVEKGLKNISSTKTIPSNAQQVNSLDEIKATQSKEQLETKIKETQEQITQLQNVLSGAKEAGYTGDMEIPQTLLNELAGIKTALSSPSEDERAIALAEAEKYYGYTIPKDYSSYKYPEMLQEIVDSVQVAKTREAENYTYQIDEINAQKQKLLTEYNQYIADIESGKLRIGEDAQLAEVRRLEQQKEFLGQYELQTKQGLTTLQRGWIGKGGLFAGPRYQAVGEYQQATGLEKQAYLSQQAYTGTTAKTAYQRAMEDYAKQQTKAGTQYGYNVGELGRRTSYYDTLKERGLQDIALEEIQKKRSLQEIFQEAVGRRTAQTLQEKYI